MELIGKIARYDSDPKSRGNYHDYVAIAYSDTTDEYLLVNFTTPSPGDGNPFTIVIKRKEFPAILKHDSEIEFAYPIEKLSTELKADAKVAPNGTLYTCSESVIKKIKSKIREGTEMEKGIARKYSLL